MKFSSAFLPPLPEPEVLKSSDNFHFHSICTGNTTCCSNHIRHTASYYHLHMYGTRPSYHSVSMQEIIPPMLPFFCHCQEEEQALPHLGYHKHDRPNYSFRLSIQSMLFLLPQVHFHQGFPQPAPIPDLRHLFCKVSKCCSRKISLLLLLHLQSKYLYILFQM